MYSGKTTTLSISVLSILVLSLIAAGQTSTVEGANYQYSAGTLTGATIADLIDITYVDLGAPTTLLSLNSLTTSVPKFLDHALIRSAFSMRAAVKLMDAYDLYWEDKLGIQPFTGAANSEFDSSNWDDERWYNYFDGETHDKISIHLGATVNDSDGDINGNQTLSEASYRAEINSKNFETDNYNSANYTLLENLNPHWSDVVEALTRFPEEETDYTETAQNVVAAGHKNLEATTLDVLKKRISILEGIPSNQIRIDNYTLNDIWLEQVMSKELIDNIHKAFEKSRVKEAFSIGSFKVESPLKVVRTVVDATTDINTYKSALNTIVKAPVRTYDYIKGTTAVTSVIAAKDTIVSGVKSLWTGSLDAVGTGIQNLKDGASWVATNTVKLKDKAVGFFAGLATTIKKIIMIIIIVVLAFLAYIIIFRFKELNQLVRNIGDAKKAN